MFGRFKNKNVLVTGAASGIGEAIALRFAQEGANVAINYHSSKDSAEAVQKQANEFCKTLNACGCNNITIQGDVSNANDVSHMVATTVETFGGLDILINNAGIQKESESHELSIEDFDRVIGTNLRGAFLCAREVIQQFLKVDNTDGVIINVSSVHQTIPKPGFVSYSVSKGGLQNLTTTLALEYAGKGIRVNAVGPGATITPINDAWINDPEKRKAVESHIPMKRAGTPEEMAAGVAFLCSDEAKYITGQTLYIDGGLTLYPDFSNNWSS